MRATQVVVNIIYNRCMHFERAPGGLFWGRTRLQRTPSRDQGRLYCFPVGCQCSQDVSQMFHPNIPLQDGSNFFQWSIRPEPADVGPSKPSSSLRGQRRRRGEQRAERNVMCLFSFILFFLQVFVIVTVFYLLCFFHQPEFVSSQFIVSFWYFFLGFWKANPRLHYFLRMMNVDVQ